MMTSVPSIFMRAAHQQIKQQELEQNLRQAEMKIDKACDEGDSDDLVNGLTDCVAILLAMRGKPDPRWMSRFINIKQQWDWMYSSTQIPASSGPPPGMRRPPLLKV